MPTTAPHVWRPSNARVVLLDSFVSVPRGSAAIAAPPLSWPAKDPADVLDYQFDIAFALIGNEGDGIAALDIAIAPNAAGDLTLVSAAADGASAVLWLGGGQAGTIYSVTLSIVTTNGRGITRTVRLPVLALSAPLLLDTALLDESGDSLTDQNGNPLTLAP
jgi:hypothetical protein